MDSFIIRITNNVFIPIIIGQINRTRVFEFRIYESDISLQEKNVSHVTSYVIMATMTMIPEMIKKSSKIIKAQQARGIETTGSIKNRAKAFFPSLGPLIISSLSEIDEKTITLEARGFASENEKTCLKEIKKTTADRIIFYVFIALVVLVLVWRFK